MAGNPLPRPRTHSKPRVSTQPRPKHAADYLGISESTLAKLRMRVNRLDGPKFIKVSGCVLYRRSDLDHWLHSHIVDGEG
ncbi:helix-turn-helix domain-containing protein [Pseudoruegeria sp. M32A2M]|nr:helix-turn-helix domain-containing protein [Pseudoruegeria sp. M32A2M]